MGTVIATVPYTDTLTEALGAPTPAPPVVWPTPDAPRTRDQVATWFGRDTRDHQIQVLLDQGLYRHLRFARPDSSEYWFEIVTSPNLLTLHGDMGTYVFSRTADMLDFFRGKDIDPAYWAQKLCADDGVRTYTPAELITQVVDYVEEYLAGEYGDLTEDDDARAQAQVRAAGDPLRAAVIAEVLSYADNEAEARLALDGFEHDGFEFYDTGEWDLTEFTFHYLWACHALVMGVAAYDAHRAAQAAQAAEADPAAPTA